MEVIAPGTKVKIGGDVSAVVTAVTIRGRSHLYEVAWWSGTSRNCSWLEPSEVEVDDSGDRRNREPLTIGFVEPADRGHW